MRLYMVATVCALAAGSAAGQALLEHSLAAIGGSAAGVAGKTVSDGIDKVFRKLDKQLAAADQAEKDKAKAKKEEPWYANMYSTPLVKPKAKGRSGSRVANPLMALPRLAYDPMGNYIAPRPPRAPRRPPVTTTQIAQVLPGSSRDQVLSSLGRPSARVTIPEGATLVEIYQYAAQGAVIGALRLSDGVVASVRVVER